MLTSSRIGTKSLAAMCRRLATSLSAGVDARTVWLRESNAARGAARRHLAYIEREVAGGSTMADALKHTGYFPELFLTLVDVGEQSGQLPEVLRRLADHYDHQVRLQRTLLSSLAWPLFELVLALTVVGVLIYVMGAIPALANNKLDLLGFGLTGTRGLVIYLSILALIAVFLFVVYRANQRGRLWAAPIQRLVHRIPGLGRAVETISLAQMSWAMGVTFNTGMDVQRALRLSLDSTRNAHYRRHTGSVLRSIGRGESIHESLRASAAFPPGFLDVVQVGEESGQLVESMEHLAEQYQQQARTAMSALSIALGVFVMALIGAFIIFLIFRLFSFYLGTINDAMKI